MSTVYFRGTDDTLWAVDWDPTTSDRALNQSIIQTSDRHPNTTSSTPFVVAGDNGVDRVYFQGTDNTLWTVNWDTVNHIAFGQTAIGNNTTSSTPFVIAGAPLFEGGNEPDHVYFQGTDNTLWFVNSDGSGQMPVPTSDGGPNTTNSSPYVISGEGDRVYFQGTDDTLWFLGWSPGDSKSNQFQIGPNTTSSSPFVVPGQGDTADQVYFRGTDDTLWFVYSDGLGQTSIGSNTTLATPYVVAAGVEKFRNPTIYFRGTDDTLWAAIWDTAFPASSRQFPIPAPGGFPNTTSSTPFVIAGHQNPDQVYFQGTDNTLWFVNSDGSGQMPIRTPDGHPNTTSSSPFVIER
jgi:hypothetical protein